MTLAVIPAALAALAALIAALCVAAGRADRRLETMREGRAP